MPIKETVQPRFYEEQYLGSADLTAVVEYARAQSARHSLGAHTWGIAMGLEIEEKASPSGGGLIDLFIQPGFAWDGFGRPIVLLAPQKIPADLFTHLLFDGAIDNGVPEGRLVKVWVRYVEEKTGAAPDGFVLCDRDDQFSRVFERFRLEIGEKLADEQHGKISVTGKLVDARSASPKGEIFDESIPYQELPEAGETRRWLIPLGSVRWKPDPVAINPGKFIARSPADIERSERERQYMGVVAESIGAAGRKIRMRSRTTAYSPVNSDDLVWVEGKLRVDSDARLFGGQLELRNAAGQDLELRLRRTGGDPSLPRKVQIAIGPTSQFTNSFAVGPLEAPDAGGNQVMAEKFVVTSLGNVGVGSSNPALKLQIEGDFGRDAGPATVHLWGSRIGDVGGGVLFVRAFPGGVVAFDGANNSVGIGTNAPNRKLTIQGDLGTYLNVKADGGAHEVLLGADANGGIVSTMTNHDLQLRAGANSTKMVIKANGDVGIGTGSPDLKLDIQGDFGRSNESATLHLFGSRIGDVGSGVLFFRSGGAVVAFDGGDRVGVGLNTPVSRLHVTDSVNADASLIASHVAIVENTSGGDSADVLALKVASGTPQSGNNYITFFAGNTAIAGIEGNGFGGVSFNSSGADIAEALPLLDPEDRFEEGDVVGVFEGKVSRCTRNAQLVTAVSRRPILVGNMPPRKQRGSFEEVALVGQVRIKVRGAVQAGDYLIASGLDDGTATAVNEHDMTFKNSLKAIGRAWESNDKPGVKIINAFVRTS